DRPLSATGNLVVNIQSHANIVIDTVITNTTIVRPDRWVLAIVDVQNTGGTAVANGTITLTFTGNGSSYVVSQTAVNVTMGSLYIPANGRIGAQIRFLVSATAGNNLVIWVNATFSGKEAISDATRTDLAADITAKVTVLQGAISFTIVIVGGRTTYVRGFDSFVVRATVDNTDGSLAITNANITLSFGSAVNYVVNTTYTGLTIAAGNVAAYNFLVNVTATATLGGVIVLGTMNGRNPDLLTKTSQIAITTYNPSNVVLTNVAYLPPGNGTYIAGTTFVVRMTFTNNGGVNGLGVTAVVNFNGASGLTSNSSNTITVVANVTSYIDFLITVNQNAISQPSVNISASWTGTGQYSGRPISGKSITYQLVAIKAHASLAITSFTRQSGNGTYIAGQNFVIRIALSNPVTSAKALSVTASVSFGGASGISANISASITVSGTGYIDFLVTIAAGAPSQPTVTMTATVTGTEELSGLPLGPLVSLPLNASIKAQADLAITSITWQSGNGTYVAGTSFVVRVSLSNPAASAKAITVTAPLSFGGASGIFANASASKTVSGVAIIDFLVTIAAGAASQPSVTITTTVGGTEEISGRTLGPLTRNLSIIIKAQAALTITGAPAYQTGNGTYVAGTTFVVRVSLNNPAAS
ncbi:MAG: beta strand repeat-containing protein, partial [Candidatus Sigynarchaeota archaeon]